MQTTIFDTTTNRRLAEISCALERIAKALEVSTADEESSSNGSINESGEKPVTDCSACGTSTYLGYCCQNCGEIANVSL